MDMNFLKPFIDGTIHTLNIQCEVTPVAGKPYLKSKDAKSMRIDIAGVVGIWSEKFKGSICICFPERTFLNIMGKMLGEEYSTINDEVSDGAGEIMNIVFGYAKRVLNQQGHELEKALPNIVIGENIKVTHNANDPVIILPFESPLGMFQLEIGIAK